MIATPILSPKIIIRASVSNAISPRIGPSSTMIMGQRQAAFPAIRPPMGTGREIVCAAIRLRVGRKLTSITRPIAIANPATLHLKGTPRGNVPNAIPPTVGMMMVFCKQSRSHCQVLLPLVAANHNPSNQSIRSSRSVHNLRELIF